MLAVMGGTGLYEIAGLEILERCEVDTPFGRPSAPVTRGRCGRHELLFLPRHGEHHEFLPHEINYRANIFALKNLGAEAILGFSAVGSLQADLPPGDLVSVAQYIDDVKGVRVKSFFGNGVAAHVSTAIPTSANYAGWVCESAAALGLNIHPEKTYVCIDGPRLGTKAESHKYRQWGCDVIGMTNVPEAFLAREAQMAYTMVAMVTDFDCWMDDPAQHVTVQTMLERYSETLGRAKQLLFTLLQGPLPTPEAHIRSALKGAVLTAENRLLPGDREWLNVLLR